MRVHSMTTKTDTECECELCTDFTYLVREDGYETLSKNVITATLREHSLVNTAHHRFYVTSRRFNHSTIIGRFGRGNATLECVTRVSLDFSMDNQSRSASSTLGSSFVAGLQYANTFLSIAAYDRAYVI